MWPAGIGARAGPSPAAAARARRAAAGKGCAAAAPPLSKRARSIRDASPAAPPRSRHGHVTLAARRRCRQVRRRRGHNRPVLRCEKCRAVAGIGLEVVPGTRGAYAREETSQGDRDWQHAPGRPPITPAFVCVGRVGVRGGAGAVGARVGGAHARAACKIAPFPTCVQFARVTVRAAARCIRRRVRAARIALHRTYLRGGERRHEEEHACGEGKHPVLVCKCSMVEKCQFEGRLRPGISSRELNSSSEGRKAGPFARRAVAVLSGLGEGSTRRRGRRRRGSESSVG